ncbi:SDR family oxidoreductase [Ulvibacter antarcticus]|uniref:NAD(P)-dependent dehydrogenase (Short-subunit alcohol dehydrogenase family) n=1 Tax=Ulvibacter antarcticus TaxID=442714 RepID=A0A3L9Z3I4_9FLAO|nr:SDR family NAD(P)-dependent oxidoreductase [Ulvibacter antarcticus]RMA65989.1 hypothetical protein BXY75_0405 [Ulvibacter antarcticus]
MANILITGGTGLLGFHMVKSMLNEGHKVVFTTRSKEKADNLLDENHLDRKNVSVIEIDFSSENFEDELMSQISIQFDVLIFNARNLDNLKIDNNGKVSAKQFQDEFAMAVTIPYLITNKILDEGHKVGDIIFIGSMYGSVAPNPQLYDNFEGQSPINYGIAKAAQIHLSKELAVRLAPSKIRCNTISYGGIEGRVDVEFKKRYARLTPLSRMLKLDDIYPPIKMLLDNAELPITGENIKIDGGWTIW